MKNFIILLLLISSLSFAQSFNWVTNLNTNISINPDMPLYPSGTDNQGNVIFGTLNSYKINYSLNIYGDVTIKKLNSNGLNIFTKSIPGRICLIDIQCDNNNNIYVSGVFMDTLRFDSINYILNTGSGLNTNYFIIKLNSSGNYLWGKNINAEFPLQYSTTLSAIKITSENLFIGIANFSNSHIKKLDLNGNLLMSIDQSNTRGISGIDVDNLGNIYATGAVGNGTITFGDLSTSAPFAYNMYFVKYTQDGHGIWVKFVEDATFQSINIVCNSSGGIYASGDLMGSFMFGNIQAQGPNWVYDFFITKLDSSGNFLWLREVPNNQGSPTGDAKNAKIKSIAVDIQDNIYFTGFLRGTILWGGGVISVARGYEDILILKFNSNGNIIWSKSAGCTSGGYNRGDAISVDISGNIFVSGNFSNTVFFDTITVIGTGYVNAFVTKINPTLVTGILNNQIINGFNLYQNYPNPFNPVTNIRYSIAKNDFVTIKIFDALGKEISTHVNEFQKSGTYEILFDAKNLSSGIYYFKLQTREFSDVKKMVLIK